MKKIVIVDVDASSEFACATIEAARLVLACNDGIIVIGADCGLEMDPEEVKQKLMKVAHANTKLTLSKDDVIPLLAGEYYDDPVSLRTQNKPFYYGVPKSKKRGRKR